MTDRERLEAARNKLTEALQPLQGGSEQGALEVYENVSVRGDIARCVKRLSDLAAARERSGDLFELRPRPKSTGPSGQLGSAAPIPSP